MPGVYLQLDLRALEALQRLVEDGKHPNISRALNAVILRALRVPADEAAGSVIEHVHDRGSSVCYRMRDGSEVILA